MNQDEIKRKSAIITAEYLTGRTLQVFADALGINASRQMVWAWKSGAQAPAPLTCMKVIQSPTAEGWAKDWAAECLQVYLEE